MKKMMFDRLYSIEFLRGVFCLTVIFYHITMGSIVPYTNGDAFYKWCSSAFANSGFVVECFFIISGYFLMSSIRRRPDETVLRFFLQKICRLWPLFFVSTIITHYMTGGVWAETFINSCFLQMTGLTFSFRGINWYVSAMFWSLVFYFLLLKCIADRYRRCFTIFIISWAAYAINLQTHTPIGFGREVVFGFLSLGLLRGIAGVGLGILINEFIETVRPYFNHRINWRIVILATALELLAVFLLVAHLFFRTYKGVTCKSHFIVVVAFAILLPLLILKVGLVSKLFNNRVLGILGKYSYSMYVMQQAGFWVLQKTLWLNTEFITEHVAVTLIVSVGLPALMGIVSYYLIEVPGAKLLTSLGRLLISDEKKEI